MIMPLDALSIDVKAFETADPKTQQLAQFCAELLEAIRYTLDVQ